MLEIIYYLYISCAEGKVYSGWHDQNYRLKWIMSGDNGQLSIFWQYFNYFAAPPANFATKYPPLCICVCLFANFAIKYPTFATKYPNFATKYPNFATKYPNFATKYPNFATIFLQFDRKYLLISLSVSISTSLIAINVSHRQVQYSLYLIQGNIYKKMAKPIIFRKKVGVLKKENTIGDGGSTAL